MRQRRSTRKTPVYKRKSRKYKKTTRRDKRHNKQSIKRYNYRGGGKIDLNGGEQIHIDDNPESKGIFYLGDFKPESKGIFYLGNFKQKNTGRITFYIKFPKMLADGGIPFFINTYRFTIFNIELYSSSGKNSNILDTKFSNLLIQYDEGNIEKSSIFDDSMDYHNLNINELKIIEVIVKLFKQKKREEYTLEEYNKLESK